MSQGFSIDVKVRGAMEEVIGKVTEALAAEKFGILTRIDVDKTLKKKIDVDFRPYVILGACNPGLAHQALEAMPEIGMMLPCNVTVEETAPGECLVRFLDPKAMMSFQDLGRNETLQRVGSAAAEGIGRAAKALAG